MQDTARLEDEAGLGDSDIDLARMSRGEGEHLVLCVTLVQDVNMLIRAWEQGNLLASGYTWP